MKSAERQKTKKSKLVYKKLAPSEEGQRSNKKTMASADSNSVPDFVDGHDAAAQRMQDYLVNYINQRSTSLSFHGSTNIHDLRISTILVVTSEGGSKVSVGKTLDAEFSEGMACVAIELLSSAVDHFIIEKQSGRQDISTFVGIRVSHAIKTAFEISLVF